MLPCPLALRLNPSQPIREQEFRDACAARRERRGAGCDRRPRAQQLGETGRRELRHLLRSVELSFAALSLPTRRPFDTTDQLDDRLRCAELAFTMAYELGTTLVLRAWAGCRTSQTRSCARRFSARCANSAAVPIIEACVSRWKPVPTPAGPCAGMLDGLASPGLAASIDPAALLQSGHDALETISALGPWVAHAYATDATATQLVASVARRSGFPSGAATAAEYLGAGRG